ncbi:MAG: hypothetical protein KGJ80_14690 [Chloroflexota bacterium]|nr:hypothetical protein [Chloroflexota bacterium]
MRQNITQLWGHLFALFFTAVLLLVGMNFFQLQPLLSAVILSIFAAIYLAAALISRRSLTVYPATLLLVVAYNLVLYGLGVPGIFLPLASSPVVFVLYLLARRLNRKDFDFVSGSLNGAGILVVIAIAFIVLLQAGSYAATASVVASFTLILLALHFILRFALEHKTWHQWAFIVLVVPGYLFLLHGYPSPALYLASAVMFVIPVWNLTRKQMVGESALLIATALYVASAASRYLPETLIPVGYAAAALALVSVTLSQYRWLQQVVPALASGLVLTVVPIALTFPWNQYSALFPFLALVFFLYVLSGSVLLRREQTMLGLIAGHVHVAFAEFIACVTLAYAAFEGFPPGYAYALLALLMAAVAVLAGLRVSPMVIKFRRHFFYLAGVFLTFGFLTALWRANPLGSTAANLSLTVVLLLGWYAVVEWSRSKVDRAGYETLLEAPAMTVAIAGALYVLGRSPGFSIDLLLPVGLMLPGALVYWRRQCPQALASSIVGLAVLILAALFSVGASSLVAALVFLALGIGLVVWEVGAWSYLRLLALGVTTLALIGLSYPWGVPGVFVIGALPVVYLIAASFVRAGKHRVTRIVLEASGYALVLLSAAALAFQVLLLPATILAAVYALVFFFVTGRNRQAAYLYPACGFTVLAAFLAALIAGLGVWYLAVAFPLTAIFYLAGSSLRSSESWRAHATEPLNFGGHFNAVVGAVAFLLLTTRLYDVVAFGGAALYLIVYAWMAYSRHERVFLAGAGLAVSLLILVGLSFLPFVERANVLGYFIPIALILLGYGWFLRRRGDTVGSAAVLAAVSVVALVSSGVLLWGEGLTLASMWTVLIVGSLVWLGMLMLTRLEVFVYLITASLALFVNYHPQWAGCFHPHCAGVSE